MRINAHLLQPHMTVNSGGTQHSGYRKGYNTSKQRKAFPRGSQKKKKKNAVTQNFTELVKGKQNFKKNKLLKTLLKVNSD